MLNWLRPPLLTFAKLEALGVRSGPTRFRLGVQWSCRCHEPYTLTNLISLFFYATVLGPKHNWISIDIAHWLNAIGQ